MEYSISWFGPIFISEEWSNGLAAVVNELKRRGLAEMKTCNIDNHNFEKIILALKEKSAEIALTKNKISTIM